MVKKRRKNLRGFGGGGGGGVEMVGDGGGGGGVKGTFWGGIVEAELGVAGVGGGETIFELDVATGPGGGG